MKKGLLLAIGVTAGLGLAAQAPKVGGVKKADLTLSKAATTDGNSVNFLASANANARYGNNATPLTAGTKFSSSYNAFTLLVSQSNCLTANQALNVVMFTHRLSQDWSADANVSSGYVEYSWTTDCGTTWDSSYYADQTNLGSKRFRYPSGAILNGNGNTTLANAVTVSTGPYTSGSTWDGYYANYQNMANGATQNTNVITAGVNSFPRVDIQTNTDSTVWVTGGLYQNDDGTTALAQMYRGCTLMKGKWDGTTVTWSMDSIKPTFHTASDGTADTYTQAHLAFSPNGQIGYCVFFGVAGGETDPHKRGFQPLTYKTTDGGTTWTMLPSFDFSTIQVVNDHLIAATDNQAHPWFSQQQGSDVVVDNNGQLHIVCTIESGSSNDEDSLGYTWTLTGQNGTTARHYIYDVHTTTNSWDAVLVDSLMTTTSDNTTIFVDGSNGGAAYATDARIQISSNTSRDHLFYLWVDSDPLALQAENALPDLYGKAVDLTTGMWTARKQFTTSQDFYFHYVSNVTLVNGTTYSVPVTNSIDRNGAHDLATTFDHYYNCGIDFMQSEFSLNIGIAENTAAFGSVAAYPNPATDLLNLNLDLVKSGNVNITMTNTLGQNVMVENRGLNAGKNNVQLNTSNLPAGVYFVNVTAEGSTKTIRVVVQ